MVQFASPRAFLRFRDATAVCGVRWFHEPGAWVERAPRRPADAPPGDATPTHPNLRLRWTRNG